MFPQASAAGFLNPKFLNRPAGCMGNEQVRQRGHSSIVAEQLRLSYSAVFVSSCRVVMVHGLPMP